MYTVNGYRTRGSCDHGTDKIPRIFPADRSIFHLLNHWLYMYLERKIFSKKINRPIDPLNYRWHRGEVSFF